jgi:lipid-A-disaccharide synthase
VGALGVFITAGEPSGDRLGAALMAALKALSPGVTFQGVGGPLMAAEGLRSLFPMEDLSVMGIAEVLPKYLHLKRRIAQTAAACAASGLPLITIDSPDFSFRVARAVRAADPTRKTIHYVAPSVWAWRAGRAAKMAAHTDHVLAILPFEPPLMTAHGMTCDFVGHPVVSEPLADPNPPPGPLILALPGSRRAEITRLAPVFRDTLATVKTALPRAQVVLPTLRQVADLVRETTADWPIPPRIVLDPGEKRQAFADATVALAASGTVSLELAANRVPMVIAYDMNRLTLWLMRRMALTDTVTLVNLVSDTRHVPEFIGADCRADLVAPALLKLVKDGPGRAAQQAAMDLTMDRLGRGGPAPALRAARSVLAALGQPAG